VIPTAIYRIITETLKSPYAIREAFQNSFKDPLLKFSYILDKNQFEQLMQRHFSISESSTEAEGIFKIFKVSTRSSRNQERLVVNVLEFFCILVLMADFGNTSQTDLIYNSELIEHKINLLLLLFDLRGKNAMNISEIILMLQTAIQSLQKMFS